GGQRGGQLLLSLHVALPAKNSQGAPASGNVTLTFPAGSGLLVKVLDGSDKKTEITDYRWIIEEDRTFYIDPNCTIARLALPHNSPLGAADAFDQAMEQYYNSTVNHAKTRSMFGFTLVLNRPGWIFRETGNSQDAFG